MFDLSPKAKTILKHLPKYIAICVLVMIILWFGVINQFLIAQEKSRFNMAQQGITYLADDIKQSIEMTKDTAWVNRCGYASQKYSRGPRSCSVTLYMLYANKTVEDANILLSKLENKMNSSFSDKVISGGELRKEFIDTSLIPRNQRFALTYRDDYCEDCVIAISYPNRTNSGNLFRDAPDNSIIISISYSSSARAEHYPVNN